MYILAFFVVFTYIPIQLEDGLGTSKVTVALIVLVGKIDSTIGGLFGVRLTGRMTPVWSIYLSAAVVGIVYLVLAVSPPPIVMGLVLLPLSACGGAVFSVRMLHLQQLGGTARSTISILTNAMVYLSTTVAGLIGGPLLTLTGNFIATGIIAFLLSTFSTLMIRPDSLGEEINQQHGNTLRQPASVIESGKQSLTCTSETSTDFTPSMEDKILADQDTQIGDSTWTRHGSELCNTMNSQYPANSCAQWRLDTHSYYRTSTHPGVHDHSGSYCFKAFPPQHRGQREQVDGPNDPRAARRHSSSPLSPQDRLIADGIQV